MADWNRFDKLGFVSDFESIYRAVDDPWGQMSYNEPPAHHSWALDLIEREFCDPVILDLGCGLGQFVGAAKSRGFSRAFGADKAPTAVEKAKICQGVDRFFVSDFPCIDLIEKLRPQVLVMSDISWYVLPRLNILVQFLKKNQPALYLIHMLTIYGGKTEQFYGADYFYDSNSIKEFFDLNVIDETAIRDDFCSETVRHCLYGRYLD